MKLEEKLKESQKEQEDIYKKIREFEQAILQGRKQVYALEGRIETLKELINEKKPKKESKT